MGGNPSCDITTLCVASLSKNCRMKDQYIQTDRLCDVFAVDQYEYQAYKDYSAGAGGGYDYYGGYDQHDDYAMYGPAVYAGELAASRGRAGRAAPPAMHRGNKHKHLSVCLCLSVCLSLCMCLSK